MSQSNKMLYAFLFPILILTGSIIQFSIVDLDVSGWDFAGSIMAKALIPYTGLIFMILSCGALVLYSMGGKKK